MFVFSFDVKSSYLICCLSVACECLLRKDISSFLLCFFQILQKKRKLWKNESKNDLILFLILRFLRFFGKMKAKIFLVFFQILKKMKQKTIFALSNVWRILAVNVTSWKLLKLHFPYYFWPFISGFSFLSFLLSFWIVINSSK